MPALIRKLAILGAVFYAFSGFFDAAAHAQTPPDADMPTISTAAVSDVPPPPDNSSVPPISTPSMDAPSSPSAPAASTTTTAHKAATHHHHHKKKTASKKHAPATKAKGNAEVREAQGHLVNLGYYTDKIDGLIGPKTRTAIRTFQHDHKMRVDGKLSKQTYEALVATDKGNPLPPAAIEKPAEKKPQVMGEMAPPKEIAPPPADFYATHPDFYGYYNQDFENALLLGPSQTLYSRFAKVDLTENAAQGGLKSYNIMLNGLPLVLVNNQSSVVGVSKTFELGDEDIIVFTSYRDHNPVCAYDYNLLVLNANGTSTREIRNCTRGYKIKQVNGSLFITFPGTDDNQALGSTWRYEKGDLERL